VPVSSQSDAARNVANMQRSTPAIHLVASSEASLFVRVYVRCKPRGPVENPTPLWIFLTSGSHPTTKRVPTVITKSCFYSSEHSSQAGDL